MLKRCVQLLCTTPASVLRLRTTPTNKFVSNSSAAQLRALQGFLSKLHEAGQWQSALEAVSDSLRHNVPVDARAMKSLLATLGAAQQAPIAVRVMQIVAEKKIVSVQSQQDILRPALFRALADSGAYDLARDQISQLVARCSSAPGTSSTRPVSSEELQLTMQAALGALKHRHTAHDVAGQPLWQSAISLFVQCRMNPITRASTPLTPELVHTSCLLLERGRQWFQAISVIRAAQQQSVLVEGATIDVVARTAFRAEKHFQVVRLIGCCIATNIAPHETTVRLGLVSCDEVSPYECTAWALSCQLLQALADNGLPILPVTYETVVRCCATSAAGRWDVAFAVVERMEREGLCPPSHLLKLVLAKRIEHAATFEETRRLSKLSLVGSSAFHKSDVLILTAQLRCALNLRDWDAFREVSTRFMRDEVCITLEKLLIQMEAAHLQHNSQRLIVQFNKLAERILRTFRRDQFHDYRHQRSTNVQTTSPSHQQEEPTQKLFSVYPADVYIPERVWDMIDAAIEQLSRTTPHSADLHAAKIFSTKLAPLRQNADDILFAANEVSLETSPRLSALTGNAEHPAWAYSAKEREHSTTHQ